MAVPTGRLTRGQIVSLATRKAGNTALGANTASPPVTDAQTWLNQILFDLASQYNWPTLNASATLIITSAQFSLPSDFLKSVDDYSFKIASINNQAVQFFVQEVDRATFDAASFATANIPATGIGQPQIWTADRNLGVGLMFPDPTGNTLACVLRYQQLPPDIPVDPSGDNTITWFPWPFLLVQGLVVQIMEFEMDPRVTNEREKYERMLEGVRQAAQPLRAQEPLIPLDTVLFTTPFRSD